MNGPTRSSNLPWICLGLACFLPLIGSLTYFVLAGSHPSARIYYGAVKLFTLLWPVLVLHWVLKRPIRFRGPSEVSVRKSLVEGLVSGIVIGGAIAMAMWTPLGDLVWGSADSINRKVVDLGIRAHFWAFALVLSFGHSLVEEYYWRGFVFGQMKERMPAAWAHGLAGTAFSLHHIVICSQFFSWGWGLVLGGSVAIGGIVWSLLYQRHGHFYGTWVSHIIVDLVLMAIGARVIFA